jgi:ribosome-associated protein
MSGTDTETFAIELGHAAIDRLAQDVRLVDLRGVVSYTDFFVVCTGQNTRQTKAISEHVVEVMKGRGHSKPRRREADPDGTWLLLDYVDVIVHIFTPEARQFYRLENLWGQVPQSKIEDPSHAAVTAGDAEPSMLDAAEVDVE